MHRLRVRSECAQFGAGANAGAHAHRVHLAVDDALVQLQQLAGDHRDPSRDVEHVLVELVRGPRRVRPTELHRFDTRDRVAGEHHLHRLAHTEEPRVEVHVGDSEPHRGIPHLRVLGHVDEVATGRELARAREAVAVHLRDHRLCEIPDAHPALGDVSRPRALAAGRVVRHLLALVPATEVVARGERRARTADDRDRHARVLVVGAQGVENRTAQRMDEAVALLGPVHRDAAHAWSRLVDDDHLRVRGRSVGLGWAHRGRLLASSDARTLAGSRCLTPGRPHVGLLR